MSASPTHRAADSADAQNPGGPPTMFFCGDDETAKVTVGAVIDAFGHEAIDVGGIDGARLLEPLCILWVKHGVRSGAWGHAFKLIRG